MRTMGERRGSRGIKILRQERLSGGMMSRVPYIENTKQKGRKEGGVSEDPTEKREIIQMEKIQSPQKRTLSRYHRSKKNPKNACWKVSKGEGFMGC